MSVVRVDLGGGNFAELEPDRYEVDRALLAPLPPVELSRDERRFLVALRSGPLHVGMLGLVLGDEATPWRETRRRLVERGLVTLDAPARVSTWRLTPAGAAAVRQPPTPSEEVRP